MSHPAASGGEAPFIGQDDFVALWLQLSTAVPNPWERLAAGSRDGGRNDYSSTARQRGKSASPSANRPPTRSGRPASPAADRPRGELLPGSRSKVPSKKMGVPQAAQPSPSSKPRKHLMRLPGSFRSGDFSDEPNSRRSENTTSGRALPRLTVMRPRSPAVAHRVDCNSDPHQKAPVLDFSFSGVTELRELLECTPRAAVLAQVPRRVSVAFPKDANSSLSFSTTSETLRPPTSRLLRKESVLSRASSPSREPLSPTSGGTALSEATGLRGASAWDPPKFSAVVLRLSSNALTHLSDFSSVIPKLIRDYTLTLTNLDLSFNAIVALPENWAGARLRFLYLHGNAIPSFEEVSRLQCLRESLTHLTLHGNPVSDCRGYKTAVLATLPRLRLLDFSLVTPVDREDGQRARARALVPHRPVSPSHR
eukprot:RCo046787